MGVKNGYEEDDENTAAVLATEVGSRRGLLLVEAPRVEEEVSASSAAVEDFCSLRSIPFERLNTAAAAANQREKGRGAGHAGGGEDGGSGSVGGGGSGGCGVGVASFLRAATRFSNKMGVIHFNCMSDVAGIVLRWQTDVTAVAEPSSLSREFVDKVRTHPDGARFSSLHDLCAHYSRVEVDGVLHTVLGKHLQAAAGGAQSEEIGAYLFKRTLPLEYLDAAAVADLFGAWREKIVVSHSALSRDVVRVLLDAQAKVVVAPSMEEEAEEEEEEGGSGTRAGMWGNDAVDFFVAFYHALYVVGADAVAALGAAVMVQPACGHFRCHMRIGGRIMTLKAGDDDLLPGDD